MSLPNYLAKIKSSGIYRFVWDKSEIAGVDAEILRLVVGYSDKGPFNTPVYVKSEAEFKSIFGDISKKLEKRGAYFHRMALQCLAKGPILALNLKKFKDEQVAGTAFDVIGEEIKPIEINVENVYDTTRFWKLSPEDAHKALCENKLTDKSNYYISFVATDSKDASCSIIMRGYHPTGYDVTIKSWYTTIGEDMPEYFIGYEDMLVSDFFAEVYVFRGKFTAALCAAEPLNRYFDIDKDGNPVLKEYVVNAFGEKVDTLPLLADESASNLVNSYSGCLLPFFKGNNGSYISLDLLFNADNHLHKMMMNLDSDLLYNGTLKPTAIATTGWNKDEKIILGTTVKKTEIKYGIENTKPVLDKSGNIAVAFENQLTDAESPVGAEPTCFEPNFVSYTTTPKNIDVKNIAGYLYFVEESITTEGEASKTYSKLVAVDDGAADKKVLYLHIDEHGNNSLFANIGDVETIPLNVVADTNAYKFTKSGTSEFYGYYCDTAQSQAMIYKKGKCTGNPPVTVNDYTPERLKADVNLKFDFSTIGLKVGDRVLYADKMYTVAEIHADHLVAYNSDEASVEIKSDFKLCNSSCGINNYGLYPVYFEGYTLDDKLAKPGLDMLSKLNWQKEILSALSPIDGYPGLYLALTNRTDIDYRYIVDTFEAFVDTEVHKELAFICKKKDNALGFLNFPSAKTFRDCPYTSFTDQNNKFQVKYIAEGGNRQKNPGRLFTLVSEDNGASFVSYNTPLTFSDGTVKTYVPSAAMVSNNFMEKYLSRQPYYIVAGPTYGRMIANGLVGPDFNYSRADLDILEPMGVNAMVYVPRLGTYINSNQTAKQNPKTALSSINVRELVIYLQDEIEKLLQDYQWEFNTPGLRELIKAKADVICERVKNNGGIYDFLNVCDKSNNTDDVIDNEMFVLSTSIEPGRGAGKMVQELTLYKTGGMQSIIR